MAHLVRPGEGLVLGSAAGVRDRFLVDSEDWSGNLAVVEHLLAPHAIAAPLHRHSKEDEFSLILEGRVSFWAGGEEHSAEVGDFVFKPRGEWHTFWNPSDQPARMLELISPGGLERMFKIIGSSAEDVDLGPLVAPFGCDVDLESTTAILERHGLTFG